jgi:hypothetical protein
VARSWDPLTTARPAGELRFGGWTFRARAERFAHANCSGHVIDGPVAAFDEPGCAPGLAMGALVASDRPRLFLSSRVVLGGAAHFSAPAASGMIRVGGRPAGWYAAPGNAPPAPGFLKDPDSGPDGPTVATYDGRILDRVWQLVSESPEQTAVDFADAGSGHVGPLPAGVHLIGDAARLHIEPTVTLEPGIVLDVTHGPIRIDAGSSVRAFTRIAGPSWIGADTTLLGGRFDAVSIGPLCKVHGEVEESVVLGRSNKAHDGFLGHAYAGSWVNLGALTTNSDLKNNYGGIRIWTPGGEADTGLMKLGCLLGDHVKTGIGVMLNTGTIVGTGSNLFGAAQPPKYVPPFSWGSGADLVRYRLDKFLAVAERAMARRETTLTPGLRSVLDAAWRAGA